MRLVFPHSHAFNGALLSVEDEDAGEASCLVEFGDGVVVVAAVTVLTPDAFEIDVPEYRTAKGTVVKARRWRIARQNDGRGWRSRRIG